MWLVVESTRDSTVLHDQAEYPWYSFAFQIDRYSKSSLHWSVLLLTITCSPSSLQRDSNGAHINLAVSSHEINHFWVTFQLQLKKSPSFSRSSSSTTHYFSLTNIFYGFLNSIECYLVFRHLSIYFLNGNNFLNIFDGE
jgi:hypothetical protein